MGRGSATGRQVPGPVRVLPAHCPAGGAGAGEGRQTDGLGCAGAGGPCWLLLSHLASLRPSHLWLLGHELTAGLWVEWAWGGHLQWDEPAGITTAAAYSQSPRVLICDIQTRCRVMGDLLCR